MDVTLSGSVSTLPTTPTAPSTAPAPTAVEPEESSTVTLPRPPGKAKGWEKNGPPPGLLRQAEQARVGFELGFVKAGKARTVTPEQVADTYSDVVADQDHTIEVPDPLAPVEEPVVAPVVDDPVGDDPVVDPVVDPVADVVDGVSEETAEHTIVVDDLTAS